MGLSFQFVVTQFLSAVLVEEAATTPAPGRRLDSRNSPHDVDYYGDFSDTPWLVDTIVKCSFGIVEIMEELSEEFFVTDTKNRPPANPNGRRNGDATIASVPNILDKFQGRLDQCILRQLECQQQERVISPESEFDVAGEKFDNYQECMLHATAFFRRREVHRCLDEYIKLHMDNNCPHNFVPGDEGDKCTDHDSCALGFYCSKNTNHAQTCQPKKERGRKCQGDQRKCKDELKCTIATGGVESKCWQNSD